MINNLAPYIKPLISAVICFPFLAVFITAPFAIYNYRKYGGIAIFKLLIFYSFILYLICAYFLTILPLPHILDVEKANPIPINWIPFSNFINGIKKIGLLNDFISIFNIKLWFKYLTSSSFFQIFANCILLLPLGFYLRYYFELDYMKTIIICFLTSLFFEITQLTGLYFIYPHSYRCPDINDLITNTFGGCLGYLITPLISNLLPSKDMLDYISWKKGEKVTLFKQVCAEIIDWIIIGLIYSIYYVCKELLINKQISFSLNLKGLTLIPFAYFVLFQYFSKGNSIGKIFLNLKIVSNKDYLSNPSFLSYFLRYLIIYLFIPLLVIFDCGIFAGCIISIFSDIGNTARILFILFGIITFILNIKIMIKPIKNSRQFPHDYYSKTAIINTKRPILEE